MKSGKRKTLNIFWAVTCAMLLAFAYPAYSEEIELPNPAKFEPAQIKTTAEINTETARESENRIIPAEEVPIPEIVNSFFAPIGETETTAAEEIPQTSAEEASESVFKPIDKPPADISASSKTNSPPEEIPASFKSEPPPEDIPASVEVSSAPQAGFEDLSQQMEDNPFKMLYSIKLPSEYTDIKTVREPDKPASPPVYESQQSDFMEDGDSAYVLSVTEKDVLDIDLEGKTISSINFKGLLHIREKVLRKVIRTREGSKFNYQRIQDDLQNIYALGYFKDNMYVEPELLKNDKVCLTFILEENVFVNKVEIVGNTVFDNSELYQFVSKMEGLPQNLNLINEAVENINQYYKDRGYILAKVSNVDDTTYGKLIFVISEGTIREIDIKGNEKTKDFVIHRNILTKPGSVYNEEFIKKDLAKLYDTQIFDKVDREIKPCPDNEEEYIVTVKVKEGPSNSVSIGLGIDNALGGFGSIGYNEKNLFGRNQKLSISGMLGSGILLSDASIKNRMNWNLEMNFFEPYFINADNNFASKLYYRDLGSYQIPLAIERRWGFNNILEHKVRGYDNITTNLALGYEYIHLREGDYAKISEIYRQSHINIARRKEQLEGGSFLNIAPGVKYSTLDDENSPRNGLVAKANFIESLGLNNINRTSGRLVGSVTKYFPVAKKSTLIVGAKGGLKVHGDKMPEVMAFRLGGPYTIRGFKMNGVGTGESFVMASAELQTPIPFMDRIKYDFFKNLRFAFFVDAGRVFNPTLTSTLYDRPLSAITVGVGLRINIKGMSTITVDYGLPLTNTGHYNSQHGYFTFGTGGLYDSY